MLNGLEDHCENKVKDIILKNKGWLSEEAKWLTRYQSGMSTSPSTASMTPLTKKLNTHCLVLVAELI